MSCKSCKSRRRKAGERTPIARDLALPHPSRLGCFALYRSPCTVPPVDLETAPPPAEYRIDASSLCFHYFAKRNDISFLTACFPLRPTEKQAGERWGGTCEPRAAGVLYSQAALLCCPGLGERRSHGFFEGPREHFAVLCVCVRVCLQAFVRAVLSKGGLRSSCRTRAAHTRERRWHRSARNPERVMFAAAKIDGAGNSLPDQAWSMMAATLGRPSHRP